MYDLISLLRVLIPPLAGVLVLVLGMRWLLPSMMRKRNKFPGAPGKPYCCENTCEKDAEFSIHGSSGHFEDVTETCEEHVGELLGTPMWLEKENSHWLVYPV